MWGIRIELLGEIAFESYMKLGEGYRYDIPTDDLGIPLLPLAEILRKHQAFSLPDNMQVGLARPDGYLGLRREVAELVDQIPNCRQWIRSLYTHERFDAESAYHIRSLQSGLVFYAPLFVRDGVVADVVNTVEAITHIGICTDDITGEVRCSVCKMELGHDKDQVESDLLAYSSLEYSLVLLAPTSLYAPYEGGGKTYTYVPGAEVRQALLALHTDGLLATSLPQMRFSNAYVAYKGMRLLPVPMCMSVMKLDREQLRCQLASGRDPHRVEQDVTFDETYGIGFDEHLMRHVSPVVNHITSSDGTLFDALSEGQVFKGTIYGTDEQIRLVAQHLREYPYLSIGALTEEGFGEALVTIDALKCDSIPKEALSTCFDVACMSHTLLYNDGGMSATRPEDLLQELERICGLEGQLEIVSLYTNVYLDYSDRFGWGVDGPVTRCLEKGSVLRVRPKDGHGVDIAPILHAFIGEGTRDGYGEIMAWPATNEYYRIAQEVVPDSSVASIEIPLRSLHLGADMLHSVLAHLLKRKVEGFARIEAIEAAGESDYAHEPPLELLEMLKDAYDPNAVMAVLVQWYEEALQKAVEKAAGI